MIPTNRFRKKIASFLLILIIVETLNPLQIYALTSGPSQPEFSNFEPIGTTNMVDPFTGDFNYNIPLFELPGPDGGYPFNLSYHSGITMDEEASWVGLGWSLNHGAITRNVRGLPDDFAGDVVKREVDIKPQETEVMTLEGNKSELIGLDKDKLDISKALSEIARNLVSTVIRVIPGGTAASNIQEQIEKIQQIENKTRKGIKLKLSYINDNYKGVGTEIGADYTSSKGVSKPRNMTLGLGVSSMDGANISANYSLGDKFEKGAGINLTSREGFQSVSASTSTKLTQNKRGTTSLKGQTTYSVSKPSYSPQVSLAFDSKTLSFDVEAGGGVEKYTGVKFKYHRIENKLQKNHLSSPAYGFFHLKPRNVADDKDMLCDFNREKDGSIRRTTTNLAIPSTTADIYSITGHGSVATVMAHRSDVGILTDPIVESRSESYRGGLELNFSGGFHAGLNLGWGSSKSKTDKWETDKIKSFENQVPNEKIGEEYEPFYLKAAGEMSSEPITEYSHVGSDDAMKLKMDYSGLKQSYQQDNPSLENNAGSTVPIDRGKRTTRKPRSTSVQFITNADLMNGSKELLNEFKVDYYTQRNSYSCLSNQGKKSLIRDSKKYPKHHAGVITVQPNGMRYNYALPVVNKVHDTYTFSYPKVTNKSVKRVGLKLTKANGKFKTDPNEDRIDYEVSNMATDGVPRSEDFYDHTITPQYNHAYLLTSILGADYIDADDIPGPSDGDHGYWVKFNYIKTTTDKSLYKWREPYWGANFNLGHWTVDKDNKASFSYGEREQYYLATAETKTHIAKFSIERRDDAIGSSRYMNTILSASSSKDYIAGVNDNDDKGNVSYKLVKIDLYSKLDDSKPLQTIKFDQGYSLCKNVDNSINGGGKLTLNSISITTENNSRGEDNKYVFDYGADGYDNPNYDSYKYDRWGNYKSIGSLTSDNDAKNELYDFPYTYQDANQMKGIANEQDRQDIINNRDKWISAWHLKKITLPSGAKINVEYESDDYGYVQDKVAMKMFKIEGLGSNTGNLTGVDNSENRKIWFKLDKPTADLNDLKQYFIDLHNVNDNTWKNPLSGSTYTFDINGRPQVYFKAFMHLKKDADMEYVSGYANAISFGFCGDPTDNKYKFGYVELEPINLKTPFPDDIHPFTALSWQMLRAEYPDQIKNFISGANEDKKNNDLGQAAWQMLKNFGTILNCFRSYYGWCKTNLFVGPIGEKVDIDKSFIRLNCPNKLKYGGGTRVKKIEVTETGTTNATYGNVYEYGEKDANGNYRSYGVANNEPFVGYDECVLRYSKPYKDHKYFMGIPIATTENLFFEYPINESYLPAPTVGYSKVKVKSLATSDYLTSSNQSFGTTGVVINEFYTAKDFPILFEETELKKDVIAFKIPLLFVNYDYEKYAGSQGYAITLNDMHGKPKETTTYNTSDMNTPITRTKYEYFEGTTQVTSSSGSNKAKKRLLNNVSVLVSSDTKSENDFNLYKKADIVNDRELGVDREFFMDMRQSSFFSMDFDWEGLNIYFRPVYAYPTTVPTSNFIDHRTRTVATNKIIRRSGILKKITHWDGTSFVETTNEVFDHLTGEPVLSSITNSFGNKVYDFKEPARFSYPNLDAAYKNWGLRFEASVTNSEMTLSSDLAKLVTEGDEFIIQGGTLTGKVLATVLRVDPATSKITLSAGINGNCTFYLVRSGRRNQVGATATNIVALEDPTQKRVLQINNNFVVPSPTNPASTVSFNSYKVSGVLNATATTFSDAWHLGSINPNETNPYKTGERGIWRPYQSFAYIEDRKTDLNGNIDISKDGTFDNVPLFDLKNPFFAKKEYGVSTNNNFSKWRMVGEVNQYGKNGSDIENKDILGKYSAVLYGYKDNLAIAVANNAEQNEIGFESFEEYRRAIFPNSGNLIFYTPVSSTTIEKDKRTIDNTGSESYAIIGSCLTTNNSTMSIWIDKPFNSSNKSIQPSSVNLSLKTLDGREFFIKGATYNKIELVTDGPKLFNNNTKVRVDIALPSNSSLPINTLFSGKVSLVYSDTRLYDIKENNHIDFNNAHTGKASLKIVGTNKSFIQRKLIPKHGKKYILNAWMKITDAQGRKPSAYTYTYGIADRIKVSLDNSTSTFSCKPKGEIIEGWQQVEGEFTVNFATSTSDVRGTIQDVIKLEFLSDGSNICYFDDIRIFPSDAEMQTYVFNPFDYKLRAVLDNNNFSTLYNYDSEGKMTVIKKETARGIKTLQESRAYIKPNK